MKKKLIITLIFIALIFVFGFFLFHQNRVDSTHKLSTPITTIVNYPVTKTNSITPLFTPVIIPSETPTWTLTITSAISITATKTITQRKTSTPSIVPTKTEEKNNGGEENPQPTDLPVTPVIPTDEG